MAMNQYIGERYTTLFADPIEWDNTRTYESLTVVIYQGASYVSRRPVPAAIDINDTRFWLMTFNYNAQVELYRQEVRQYDGRITQAQSDATSALNQVGTANTHIADIESTLTGYTPSATVHDAIAAVSQSVANVDAKIGTLPEGQTDVVSYIGELPEGQTSVVGYISDSVTEINGALTDVDNTLNGFGPEATVKDYVDTEIDTLNVDMLSNLTNGSEVNWDVAARHFRPAGYGTIQGFCVFEQNGVAYWAQGEINTDNDGQVNIYRIDTNSLVGSVTGNFGHIHGISYVDGVLYLDASLHNVAVAYVAISVSNPANPVVVTPYTQIQTPHDIARICFVSATEVHMFSWSTCTVWVYDLSTGTETLKCAFSDNDLVDVTVQNFMYYEDYNIYILGTYHKSGAAIYDATTGKRLNWINLPTLVQHVYIQESEGACICNGKLYINAAEAEYTLRLTTLFVWDFASGNVMQTLEMRPAFSVNTTYLRIDVSDSGDLVHPTQNGFRLASDAVNLMRSQGMDFELHVHISGDSYSYPIFLDNIVSRIHVNGDSVTLAAPIVIHGGNCIFGDAGKMIFNFASGTDAIITYSCVVYIAALPQISGTVTTLINATYNSQLFIPQDIVLPRAVLSRSIAFVKNSTNFVANLSAIISI